MLKKHFLSGLLLAGVIGMAVYHWQDMMAALRSLQIRWAVAGFSCLLFNYFFRAVRFYVLTNSRLNVWPRGIYCVLIHGVATYMLPLRSGDFSLPFLLKSTIGLNLEEGLAVPFKARLLEVFTLGLWFVASRHLFFFKRAHGTFFVHGGLRCCNGYSTLCAEKSIEPFADTVPGRKKNREPAFPNRENDIAGNSPDMRHLDGNYPRIVVHCDCDSVAVGFAGSFSFNCTSIGDAVNPGAGIRKFGQP